MFTTRVPFSSRGFHLAEKLLSSIDVLVLNDNFLSNNFVTYAAMDVAIILSYT